MGPVAAGADLGQGRGDCWFLLSVTLPSFPLSPLESRSAVGTSGVGVSAPSFMLIFCPGDWSLPHLLLSRSCPRGRDEAGFVCRVIVLQYCLAPVVPA